MIFQTRSSLIEILLEINQIPSFQGKRKRLGMKTIL